MTAPAYAAYLRVREAVGQMQAAAAADASYAGSPSRYWAEELDNIDYLADASWLVIRKLRHHAFHLTGIRPYDYREYAGRQVCFERRLAALIALAGGRDLLVPESEALGGFGYRIGGQLYNVDTLKFFEVLVGMRHAGLLDAPVGGQRRLVWEIGGGWGGFAYQFKTLFPQTTYVIVDFPELFYFSATYLATVFPDARLRFWSDDGQTLQQWDDADFIFVPNGRVDALRGSAPDLLVNLVSFQEMTAGQVDAYARLAADAGCPSLYSLNRERSHYNAELDSVSRVLSQYYDLREIRLLASDYMKAMKKDSAVTLDEAAAAGRVDELRYRHLAATLKEGTMSARSGGQESTAAVARSRSRATARASSSVAIGIALYNRAMHLKEAVDSLLAQSYPNFRIVLVDDGSTDETEQVARECERRDNRVRYVRFAQRRGMVAAWRAAFELATEGGATYFAWGSDHDRWHAEWLATLVGVLDAHPDVVLAYPLTQRMDPSGAWIEKGARHFETFGMTGLRDRWIALSRSDAVAAGDMVYGLMRADAVRAAGVFREVLCPDRLLMAELTLRGQIRQVPVVLWFRRQFPSGSVARQRTTLFGPAAEPPFSFTPPWFTHARALWATYGAGAGDLGLSRREAATLITHYAAAYAWRHYGKSTVQRGVLSVLAWPRWVYKRAKHAVLLGVHVALLGLRQIGVTPLVERTCERLTGRARPWRGHA